MTDVTQLEEVRQVAMPSIEGQWGKGPWFRRDGQKYTLVRRMLTIPLGLVFIATFIYTALAGEVDSRPARSRDFPTPLDTGTRPIDVPGLSNQPTEKKPENQKPEDTTNRKAPRALPGLQIIRRNASGKIPPGAISEGKIAGSGRPGRLRAVLPDGCKSYGDVFLPPGTALLGTAQGRDDRLIVRFTQAITPDGESSKIAAVALDPRDQGEGIVGSRVDGKGIKIAGAIGLNVIGGASESLSGQKRRRPDDQSDPSMRDAALYGASVAALEQSRNLMSEYANEAPIVEVPEGTSFLVLFEGEGS